MMPGERTQWLTNDGGYVLQQQPDPAHGTPGLFACTAGDNDLGVQLEPDEAFDLACWLLGQALGDDDLRLVRAVLRSTRFQMNRNLAEMHAAAAEYAADQRERAEWEPF